MLLLLVFAIVIETLFQLHVRIHARQLILVVLQHVVLNLAQKLMSICKENARLHEEYFLRIRRLLARAETREPSLLLVTHLLLDARQEVLLLVHGEQFAFGECRRLAAR